MATFNMHNNFVEDAVEVMHLGTDQIVVYACAAASAPTAANATLSALTTIAYTNLSTRNVTTSSSSQTSGAYKLILTDLVLTASGGSVAAARYWGLYDDTPTSPTDPLMGYYDYGSDLTLASGETLTIDFDSTNNAITLS